MFSWRKATLAVPLLAIAGSAAAADFPGIGRSATPKEVAAWDIDVRPDFKGLPAGRGSVAAGEKLWEAQCASCHGVFGESNQVFHPLIGGTTPTDIQRGRTATLADPAYPARTTMMKLPTVASLWDYIRRAMPWTAPKTLSTDEVYAVTAYMLHLGGVVAEDFVLDQRTIRAVQAKLPNRDGMTTRHAMWPGSDPGARAKPDVQGSACMRDCAPTAPRITSAIPDHARNAHGNLADQNRLVGPQRGMQTAGQAQAAAATGGAPAAAAAVGRSAGAGTPVLALLQAQGCIACHGIEQKIVGPAFREIAHRQAGRGDAVAYLAGRIQAGGSGVWGSIPMPPQSLAAGDAETIARWLAGGARP
ncbi:c-type cytochrome [Aquincola sp. S2]|uniref:C-type cytochrome n=1 Tax=Pseudaquabacterium terrae TaxID=2732868 RepID=A0ABX2EUJ3_9BURK|nr:c-type cytochrome [Aquabacterium terrae]NRF72343.1 c-type cytochrome [Aquabacterium terrae]